MNFLYFFKEKIRNLFRGKGKGGRHSKREPYDMTITYVTTSTGSETGTAKVIDVNSGGICLDLDNVVGEGEMLSVKLNPHTISKHAGLDKVAVDERGRHITKVVWAKIKEDGFGSQVGCAFLKRVTKKQDDETLDTDEGNR